MMSPALPSPLAKVLESAVRVFVVSVYPLLSAHAAIIPVTIGPENEVPLIVV